MTMLVKTLPILLLLYAVQPKVMNSGKKCFGFLYVEWGKFEGGVPYAISNPQDSTANWQGTPGTYSTDFETNVEGTVEHFDVYGEVQTLYSQVMTLSFKTNVTIRRSCYFRFTGPEMLPSTCHQSLCPGSMAQWWLSQDMRWTKSSTLVPSLTMSEILLL